MFERVEDNDDEAAARGDILQTLYAIKWPPDQAKKEGAEFPEFTCSNLLAHFEESTKNAERDGQPEDVGTTELRRFCTPKNAKAVSPKSISDALKAIVDSPVSVLAGTASLRRRQDTHGKKQVFWVELKQDGDT